MGRLKSKSGLKHVKRETNLLLTFVLSALLMLGILGAVGYVFSMPAVISKVVQTSEGEQLKLVVLASMRPSFWDYATRQFQLAWRVGTTPRSTVNIRFQITVTGTNIANTATAYFYVEAKDSSGSPTYREIDYSSGTSITVGSPVVYETGSMAIDTHLSHLYGSAPTADKTVTYHLWCKIVATGLISGQQLVAEIPVTQFDSVLYDYGVEASSSGSFYPIKDTCVASDYPDTNYGTDTSAYWGWSTFKTRRTFIVFDLTSMPSTVTSVSTLRFYFYVSAAYSSNTYSNIFTRLTDTSWSETAVTWNNQPSALSSPYATSGAITATGAYSVSLMNIWDSSCAGGYFGICISFTGTPGANYYGVGIRTRECYGSPSTEYRLYIVYTYIDWSASWSWLNLDTLSISGLRITQDLAPLVLVFAIAICVYLLLRRG